MMKWVAAIAAIGAIPFTIVALHDPDSTVRVWAMLGLTASMIGAMIAAANITEMR